MPAAQAQGVLRHDFAAEDVLLLLWGGGGVIDATANAAPECWRRYLALFLDGLRAAPATPLPVGPLTEKQLVGSAGRWGR